MPRDALIEGVFHVVAAFLLLVFGVYMVVDSVKNQGFELGRSSRFLMLAIASILGLVPALRRQRSQQASDESHVEEL
jgi:putative Mn2+ efflux pump MntP